MSRLWAFIKRDFLIAISYRTAFVMQLGGIGFAVPLLFFIDKLLPDVGLVKLDQYGGNYFSFLLIGVAFLDYLSVSLRTFNQSIRDSQVMGTLEIMFLSPTPLALLLLYSSAYVYLLTSVRFVLYLLVGLLFGLQLGSANLPCAMLVLVLAVPSFAAFGIFSAGVTILIKRGEAINVVLSAASVLLGGVLYPVDVLPPVLQTASKFLPVTHALEAMRLALFQGASPVELADKLALLALFVAVLLPSSLLFFALCVGRTKETGTLGQF